VPLAVMGQDVRGFLDRTQMMVRSCGPDVPPAENPGAQLGLALGSLAKRGRDKVTIVASPTVADFGAWAEQLLAESTGKQGRGLSPLADAPLGARAFYGTARVFVYLRMVAGAARAQDDAIAALEQAGQPVVRIEMADPAALGQEFYRWEIAPAVAGAIL